MSDNLRIALIQSELYWENPTANLAMFEEKIASIASDIDLIVLPEMFSTGFTMNAAAVAEPPNLTTHKWLQQIAARTGAVVTGSYVVVDNAQYYNRLLWVRPDGSFSSYDKRHLFRMANEDKHYSAGQNRLVETLKGWRICPLICYDLRFPVWARNQGQVYDLLLYVANWPAARSHAWRSLLVARAIENLSYVVGLNRVGQDEKDIFYSGDSVVLDFKGEATAQADDSAQIILQTLEKQPLEDFREKFPAYLDADAFEIV